MTATGAAPTAPTADAAPTALDGVTEPAFRLAARLRRARAFHPVGVGFGGLSQIDEHAPGDLAPGVYDTVVRFSRGAGLPDALPDLLGIGLRLLDAHGAGAHQDLLLTSSGSGALGRRVLRPRRSFASGRFGTILPYRTPAGTVLLSARVVGCGPCGLPELRHLPRRERLVVELDVASLAGPWQPFGRVAVHEQLTRDDEESLDLDPFHTSTGLVPAGFLNRLRRPAYVGSRRGRRVSEGNTPPAPCC